MQTSGASRRENVAVHLLFEIRIENQASSSRTSERSERRSGTHTPCSRGYGRYELPC